MGQLSHELLGGHNAPVLTMSRGPCYGKVIRILTTAMYSSVSLTR